MKKGFLLASALLLPALPSAAPAAEKVLLIVRDYAEGSKFDFAVQRAVQMKKAGLDVRVAFEDRAVLPFLDLHDGLDKPGWRKKMKDMEDELEADRKEGKRLQRLPKHWLAGRRLGLPPALRALLLEFLALKVPYTLSAQGARNYDALDELKAAGEPLAEGQGAAEDISTYMFQGYRVVVH